MYEIRPVLPGFDLTIPTCMYKVELVSRNQCNTGFQYENDVSEDYISGNFGAQIRLCLKESLDMADIENRQKNLLKQLQILRNQLVKIRSQTIPKTSVAEKRVENKNEIFDDLIINTSPDCIPYGVLALKSVWNGIFNINVTAYSHSNVTTLNKEARDFQSKISKTSNTSENTPYINIGLIWKNSEHTEMVTSSGNYVPIYGEINILRYLSRIGPIEYRYENNKACSVMDAVLDICYKLPCCCEAKTKVELLHSLNEHLQKSHFGGRNLNIADIGAYSALKRSLWLKQKDLESNLTKWYKYISMVLSTLS